ncbi:hypothetical protein TcWFU_009824 [Taenia crassiceps]|uniref:Uncharacterized protein n=1 Tax=Taenia crassiceps TaxID=6207 RepID=A0ABR4QJC4_9CEST
MQPLCRSLWKRSPEVVVKVEDVEVSLMALANCAREEDSEMRGAFERTARLGASAVKQSQQVVQVGCTEMKSELAIQRRIMLNGYEEYGKVLMLNGLKGEKSNAG